MLQRATELCGEGMRSKYCKFLEYRPEQDSLFVRAGYTSIAWLAARPSIYGRASLYAARLERLQLDQLAQLAAQRFGRRLGVAIADAGGGLRRARQHVVKIAELHRCQVHAVADAVGAERRHRCRVPQPED